MAKVVEFWLKSRVETGAKVGRTINFPTANLNPAVMPQTANKGVYAAWVKFNNKIYKGALYFGPRLVLGETMDVLEIYLLNFSQDIYGEILFFKLDKFIRPPSDFSNLEELKKQLEKDKNMVDKVINSKLSLRSKFSS